MFIRKKDFVLLEQAQANLIRSQENAERAQKNIERIFEQTQTNAAKSQENAERAQRNIERIFEQTQINATKSQENFDKMQQGINKYLEQKQADSAKKQEVYDKIQQNIENYFQKKDGQPLNVVVSRAPDTIYKKTQEEKEKAAYALNLCTISVSQIVEYDDIRTLDQEYTTILNNLNLQNMPSDEALLDILKQLLNVITFFKIQEGDKEMLEKEYQHNMKNAIWSAVPNMSVILTTPDPKVMLFNLATQVGLGYMNYRKQKAENQLEHEKQKWQLKRAAMEQINGLRRELFDTAWRLSKEYDFDDELRLTERQIEQFNKILLDKEPQRQYDRLLAIKENFKAYPPFFYYLGHAAAKIKENEVAIENFYEFLRLTGYKTVNQKEVKEKGNLLREDHLCASCAMELAGLVSNDRAEMIKLLEIAMKVSGNSPEVLQMCAMSYLSINEIEKAFDIYVYLVNEQYNVDLNANLLSRIFVKRMLNGENGIYPEYKRLKERKDIGAYVLTIPEVIPETKEEQNEIFENYFNAQSRELTEKIEFLFGNLSDKIKNEFETLCKDNGKISRAFADFLQDLNLCVGKLPKELNLGDVKRVIFHGIAQACELQKFLGDDSSRSDAAIETMYNDFIKEKVLDALYEKIIASIPNIAKEQIFNVSYQIDMFCMQNKLPLLTKREEFVVNNDSDEFLQKIYGNKDVQQILKDESRKERCLHILEKYKDELVIDKRGVVLYTYGENDLNSYIDRNKRKLAIGLWEDDEIIAVLNDNGFRDRDFVFTTRGYFMNSWRYSKGDVEKGQTLYSKGVESGGKDHTIMVGTHTYNNKGTDTNKIAEMIRELARETRNLQ